MTDKIFDVAIVGAGPAGSVFAKELACLCPELSVIIIDGQDEKHKKPCGGLLAPSAQKALAQSGLVLPNDILADPQIFTVETIDIAAKLTRSYQRHYLNMDRYKFDSWLLSFVPDSVTVVNARVCDIKKEDGNFRLKLSSGEINSKCVVGADGGSSIVRRKLYGKISRSYVSIQEWYIDRGQNFPYYSCIFDKKTSDSCSWTIRKDGYLIYGGAFNQAKCAEAFDAQKRRLEDFVGDSLGETVKREACIVNSPRSMRDFCVGGKGYFLLGEAAGFISSSSFEGISSAIISAKALAEAFSIGKTQKAALKLYAKKTRRLRTKLWTKFFKRAVLCNPLLRRVIMKSGVQSVKIESRAEAGGRKTFLKTASK